MENSSHKEKVIKVAGPVAESLLKVPMPGEVMDELDNLYHQLDEMKIFPIEKQQV